MNKNKFCFKLSLKQAQSFNIVAAIYFALIGGAGLIFGKSNNVYFVGLLVVLFNFSAINRKMISEQNKKYGITIFEVFLVFVLIVFTVVEMLQMINF